MRRYLEAWKNFIDPPSNNLQEKAAHLGRVRIRGMGNQRDGSEACHQASLDPHDRKGNSASCPLSLCACVQVMTRRKKCLKGRKGSPRQAKLCLVTKTGQDPTPNTWHKELASGKRWPRLGQSHSGRRCTRPQFLAIHGKNMGDLGTEFFSPWLLPCPLE